MENRKTYVADINRGIYDIKDKMKHSFTTGKGLSADVVKTISKDKNEPDWMLDLRLNALDIFLNKPTPDWGADLSELDVNDLVHYLKVGNNEISEDWDDVPEYIKKTFDRLGIPEAEKKSLSGVGAQYDSEVVYHKMNQELLDQGVVYLDMESAVREYEDIVKKYFEKLIHSSDHKFSALHYAVWSGGSFVYVPKNTKVEMPLQSYFRLNAREAGQFEHTLIVLEKGADLHFIEGCSAPKYKKNVLHAGAVELYVSEGARLRYSTIENWSRNMYNLNTKRAIVEKNGKMEWVSGSFGSRVTMLYPMTILKGDNSSCEFTGVTLASEGQYLDTGCKVVHIGKNTTSNVKSKSISKNGGTALYRGLLHITKTAEGSKSMVDCESLMLDNLSRSDTIPTIKVDTDDTDLGHEAKIGKISEDSIFYLMSRGLSEETAKALIIKGFVDPITKELPLEYAVELNNLLTIELEGTIG